MGASVRIANCSRWFCAALSVALLAGCISDGTCLNPQPDLPCGQKGSSDVPDAGGFNPGAGGAFGAGTGGAASIGGSPGSGGLGIEDPGAGPGGAGGSAGAAGGEGGGAGSNAGGEGGAAGADGAKKPKK